MMKAADIALARMYNQQVAQSNFTKPKDLVAYMGALQAQDYAWVTDEIVAIAERHARGRIVSMLEGGYDLEALRESSVAHVAALIAD